MLARKHRFRGPVLVLCLAAHLVLVGCGGRNVASDTGNVAFSGKENGALNRSSSPSPAPTQEPTRNTTTTSPSRENDDVPAGNCNGTIGAVAVDDG